MTTRAAALRAVCEKMRRTANMNVDILPGDVREWLTQIEAALAQGEEEVSELRAMNADKAKTIEELSSTIFKRERTFSPAEREALTRQADHLEMRAPDYSGANGRRMLQDAATIRAMLAERSANE